MGGREGSWRKKRRGIGERETETERDRQGEKSMASEETGKVTLPSASTPLSLMIMTTMKPLKFRNTKNNKKE